MGRDRNSENGDDWNQQSCEGRRHRLGRGYFPFQDDRIQAQACGDGANHDRKYDEEDLVTFTTFIFDRGEEWELTTTAISFDGTKEWIEDVVCSIVNSVDFERAA